MEKVVLKDNNGLELTLNQVQIIVDSLKDLIPQQLNDDYRESQEATLSTLEEVIRRA